MASRDHEWFVGEMGLTFEADGFTRIGGRLFGHLLLAEGPLSLDAIAETLQVSKASVSTDATLAMQPTLLASPWVNDLSILILSKCSMVR